MKKTYKQLERNGRKFNLLALPNTNFFKLELINKMGSNIERLYKKKYNKNVYGISHFIEHLSFRRTKDFTTIELMENLKNEGTYNASTDYDRINYWFETSMENIDLGIKLVANITYNTLKDIPEEEYEIEKKVVMNEAKRYADDDQTMFWFNTTGKLVGYEEEDNVIGIPETIDTFELEDCVNIKDIFLQNNDQVINVTYDPTILTAIEVMDKINMEINRYKPLCQIEEITTKEYMEKVKLPTIGDKFLKNESDQSLVLINLDVVDNFITASMGTEYLLNYANNTSLTDIIREQNGLTYGVHMYTSNTSYKPYTQFGCDVSRGTEDLLMELFNKSINETVDKFDQDKYDRFMKTVKLKRTMSLLNLRAYDYWHNIATWYPEIIEDLRGDLEIDLDQSYEKRDKEYSNYEKIKEYIGKVKEKVNNIDYGKVISKK
jgi:predicted Zn-dependent peptidase